MVMQYVQKTVCKFQESVLSFKVKNVQEIEVTKPVARDPNYNAKTEFKFEGFVSIMFFSFQWMYAFKQFRHWN